MHVNQSFIPATHLSSMVLDFIYLSFRTDKMQWNFITWCSPKNCNCRYRIQWGWKGRLGMRRARIMFESFSVQFYTIATFPGLLKVYFSTISQELRNKKSKNEHNIKCNRLCSPIRFKRKTFQFRDNKKKTGLRIIKLDSDLTNSVILN